MKVDSSQHRDHSKASHQRNNHSQIKLATHATLHCLIGCAGGEVIGLLIGVSLALGVTLTITLATVMGFASGYILGLLPLVREGKGWLEAFRIIWLGETISIAVMELVMNLTDYYIGGVQAGSIISYRFWLGYIFALPAGFVAAWPVNYWLLSRNIRSHSH